MSQLPLLAALQNRSQLIIVALSASIALGFLIVITQALMTSEPAVEQTLPIDAATPMNASPLAGNGNYAQQIAALNSFGTVQVVVAKPAAVKPTRLKLKLLGVVSAADDQQTSLAIISGKSTPEAAFGVGEKLPGGATLEEVYPTHVILKYNGQLEQLDLVRDEIKLDNPLPAGSPSLKK